MVRFVCIHGHFYQPPRENPWMEKVELQDSATPYHDWNERVTAECYLPNAHARFVDGQGRIKRIVSNYSRISFDFGPTLLSWLKDSAPDVYRAILDAETKSRERFAGHGSAMAQCYNHVIMPLANRRDKLTQVRWGVRDFEWRFGRAPEGMWLPECAADTESLEALAEGGIRFTILSPYQAKRVRLLDAADWQDVNGGGVDPSQPYLLKLPSGRAIAVFFYDGPISRGIAFEHLLDNGERFAERLMGAFDPKRESSQLVHIATDGESYGHHHRYGEMALAYALSVLENSPDTHLTNYGEYLERHPPTRVVEIHQPSAWSCPHGVDRWRADCGCSSGGYPQWNQQWRKPLREALDALRDRLALLFERQAAQVLTDPWRARDDYIDVLLDRTPDKVARFVEAHAARPLDPDETVTMLRLLEMQRHALLMFTSCGWFFDDISGIETVQIILYAARAIQLAATVSEEDLETPFLQQLAAAASNVPAAGDGRGVYEKFVKPAIMTHEMVGAQFSVSSLFESYPEKARIYSFLVNQRDRQLFTAGSARLAVGRIDVTFTTTGSTSSMCYSVLHMGDHNLSCGVRPESGVEAYERLVAELRAPFDRGAFPELFRVMDDRFGARQYSLKSLFRDEQRKILSRILATTRDEVHNTYRLLTDRYAPLMRYLGDLGAPALPALEMAMRFVLNFELRRQFESDAPDVERVRSLLDEIRLTKVPFEESELEYAARQRLWKFSDRIVASPGDVALLKQLTELTAIVRTLPFETNLLKPQNDYYDMQQSVRGGFLERAAQGDPAAEEWIAQFSALGEALGFLVEAPVPAAIVT